MRTGWLTKGAGAFVILAASTPFSWALKPRETVDATFRPSVEERRSFEKFPEPSLAPTELSAEAERLKDPQLHVLAGKAWEFLSLEPDRMEKARAHYRQAAALGSEEAAVRVAWFAVEEEDTPARREKALQDVRAIARTGHVLAQTTEASMMVSGFAGPDQVDKGIETIRLLADQGVTAAEYLYGTMLMQSGDPVPENPSAAFAYMKKAAEKGHAGAQLNLGVCYGYGIGVESSFPQAVEWYLKAAQQGDLDAQHNLGNAFLQGRGVPADFERAQFWLRQAAQRGVSESMVALSGSLIQNGAQPGSPEAEEAIGWLEKAAQMGNPLGNFILGGLLLEGTYRPYAFDRGFELIERSAQSGAPYAQLEMARLLRFGNLEGLQADRVEAVKWAMLAARQGQGVDYLQQISASLTKEELAEALSRAQAFSPKFEDASLKGKSQFIPQDVRERPLPQMPW